MPAPRSPQPPAQTPPPPAGGGALPPELLAVIEALAVADARRDYAAAMRGLPPAASRPDPLGRRHA